MKKDSPEKIKKDFTDSSIQDLILPLSQNIEDLENFIKDLWSFLPLSICYVNPLFRILDVNSAMESLFGWKIEELIGEEINMLFADKTIAGNILDQLIKERKIINKELEIARKDGEKITIVFSAGSRQNPEGETTGYYLTFSDISELKNLQKKAEERGKELKKLTEDLESQVKLRTTELEEKVKELEKFRRFAVGRELKMVSLKKELKELKNEPPEKNQ